jgi:predicted DNA-binding transcriptional regulator YafY
MAILFALMQTSETAQALADKFEVSRRTILRDMQSLSEMGIPLYSATGPSGGFALMNSYQLQPLQLDSQEALTLLFALGAMTKLADTPFNQARWTVIHKIKAVVPNEMLKKIEPLLEHVELEVPDRRYKTPHLSALLDHTANSQWLQIFYRSEKHHRWLDIRPKRIYTAHGFWYCEAYSVHHQEHRTFRIDRFDQVKVIDPPQAAQGNHPMKKIAENPQPTRIVVKLCYRGALVAEQDPHIGQNVKQTAEDEWELDFMCPASEWVWAVRFFYTLGLDAEVIEPDSLKSELFRLASQICARYNTTT